jgi:23S rRNA-/tRNA-specific pseudouridylate synthase
MVRPISYWYFRCILQLKHRHGLTKCKLQPNAYVLPMKRSIVAVASTAASVTVTATTTISSETEVVDTIPVDVALVWKYVTTPAKTTTPHRGNSILNEAHILVALQQVTDETTLCIDDNVSPTTLKVPAVTETNPSSNCTTIHKYDDVDDAQTNINNDVDVIPESVLIYERQIRKSQHARKTSQPLTDADLNVIYVDEYLVVLNKPAGVLTVPGLNNNPSILDLVYKKYGVDTVTDPVHMIVHRLDMDTSGIVVFARTLTIAKQLHAIFRDRLHITKQYECLVMGHLRIPPNTENTIGTNDGNDENEFAPPPTTDCKILIDLPIQRDHEHPPFMRISTPRSEKAAMECVDQLQLHGWKKIMRKAAKPSQSVVVQILEYGSYKNDDTTTQNDVTDQPQQSSLPYTRLRLEPITGRTHQLRVHWYVDLTFRFYFCKECAEAKSDSHFIGVVFYFYYLTVQQLVIQL